MAPFSPLPPSRIPTSPCSQTTNHSRPYSQLFGQTLPITQTKRALLPTLTHLIERYTWMVGLALICLATITCLAFFPDIQPSLLTELPPMKIYEEIVARPVILHELSPRDSTRRGKKRLDQAEGDHGVVYVRQEDLSALLSSTEIRPTSSSSLALQTTLPGATAIPASTTTTQTPNTSTSVFTDPTQARDPSAERPGIPQHAGEANYEEPKQTGSAENQESEKEST